MAAQLNTVFQQLRRVVLMQDGAGLSDGQLLEMFISQKDQAAFEALVRRYSSMVMKVCRRVIGNHHDAEDVYQTTFLVLARKASTIRPREMVANWLHGVAFNAALNARKSRTRRWGRERQVAEMPDAVQHDAAPDLHSLLDQEVNRLAEVYRLPILLCDLEGKSIKRTAQQLGWPQGTVAGRLARGRKLLAKRLARHGLAITGGVVVLQNSASACVSPSLVASTVKAACAIASGKTAATGLISANVAILMKGALSAMSFTKLKIAMTVLLVAGVVGLGGSLITYGTVTGQQTQGEGLVIPKKEIQGEKDSATSETVIANADMEKLQGEWKLVLTEFHDNGEKEEFAGELGKMTFDGGRLSTFPSATVSGDVSFKTDATKTPKQICLFSKNEGKLNGIYLLDGDDLMVCFNFNADEAPPTGFTTKKEGHQLMILKRWNAIEDEADEVGEEEETLNPDQRLHKVVKGLELLEKPLLNPPLLVPPPVSASAKYHFDFNLFEMDEDGEKRIGWYNFSKLEGEQGYYKTGLETGGAKSMLLAGIACTVNVSKINEGRLRLDLQVEKLKPNSGEKNELRVQGTSQRIIKIIKLGEKISIELDGSEKSDPRTRVDLTVSSITVPPVFQAERSRNLSKE